MFGLRRWALLLFPFLLSAQSSYYPLSQVRAGQRAVGKTVFQGDKVEEFQAEILGVLDHVGPQQSLILARLSGGPLEKTGVMQGMSGSPVYLDGKLLGAVAIAFPFAKEPIAGIRPIEEMTRTRAVPQPNRPLSISLGDTTLAGLFKPNKPIEASGWTLQDIATPVAFTGFSHAAIDHFAPQLRQLGMEPRQGVTGQGRPSEPGRNSKPIEPGSMISVQLVTGDLTMGADGTVTQIEGDRVYAFGHQFLSLGVTELPFARASVLTLLSNLNTSFKISTAQEWVGSITEDRSAAVAGQIGRRAAMVPVKVAIKGPLGTAAPEVPSQYQLQVVRDRALTPFLLQMAIFSIIDATQRTNGSSSYALRGRITFQDDTPPLVLDNVFGGDFNVPAQVSLAATLPLAYLLQSQFDAIQIKDIDVQLTASNRIAQLQSDQLISSKREARPGDRIELTAVLAGNNGTEVTQKVTYTVPPGAPPGPLYFTLADGGSLNLLDYAQLSSAIPRSRQQLLRIINNVRSNQNAYVRVWRAEASFQVNGADLPDPPASLTLLLNRTQAKQTIGAQNTQAKLQEFVLPFPGHLVSGSKTIQVEVKE